MSDRAPPSAVSTPVIPRASQAAQRDPQIPKDAHTSPLSPVAASVAEPNGVSEPSVVNIDTLHATFLKGAAASKDVMASLGAILDIPVFMRPVPGTMGYSKRYMLDVRRTSQRISIGALCEGEAQRNWNLFQLNARGCTMHSGRWQKLHDFFIAIGARITRIDIAVDFPHGEHDVDEAVKLYKAGAFDVRGRRPKCSLAGDWMFHQVGRTFYVGIRVNGKLLRVYEKGRQLGDLKSPWVRWELQLGRKERDLPLSILLDPSPYFAGAYDGLKQILPVASITLPIRMIERKSNLVHRLYHLRASYGATLDEALSLKGATPLAVVSALRGVRSDVAEVPAVTWHEVLSSLERR